MTRYSLKSSSIDNHKIDEQKIFKQVGLECKIDI